MRTLYQACNIWLHKQVARRGKEALRLAPLKMLDGCRGERIKRHNCLDPLDKTSPAPDGLTLITRFTARSSLQNPLIGQPVRMLYVALSTTEMTPEIWKVG
jgi:hypothetical protein